MKSAEFFRKYYKIGRQEKYIIMKDIDNEAFINLFKQCYQKCFGYPLEVSMPETESKHFSNIIFEKTGLVIGAKTIKNYSAFVLNSPEGKHQNPSIATLDTLARYLLDAPYTDEVKRKTNEGHHPYWFQYKSNLPAHTKKEIKKEPSYKKYLLLGVPVVVIFAWLLIHFTGRQPENNLMEDFHSAQMDSLHAHGWFVKSKDTTWWAKRNEYPNELTLYTLKGDNWPDSVQEPVIKNLLIKKIPFDCFSTEVHLDNFLPKTEWQQAGILLMEDTTFKSRCVRLTLAYNDFFGGFSRPSEIIIQAVRTGKGYNHPEEIGHLSLFNFEAGNDSIIKNNMRNSALRIEKNNDHLRFLYSAGPLKNFAYKEAFTSGIDFKPNYVGIFALKGFVNDTNYIPVRFSFFSLQKIDCEK